MTSCDVTILKKKKNLLDGMVHKMVDEQGLNWSSLMRLDDFTTTDAIDTSGQRDYSH